MFSFLPMLVTLVNVYVAKKKTEKHVVVNELFTEEKKRYEKKKSKLCSKVKK